MGTPFAGAPGRTHSALQGQTGLSLLELMVSISMGLLLLAALAGVLESGSSSARANDRTAEMSTTGRYALSQLKDELRQAGFRGYTWAKPSPPSPWTDPAKGCADSGSTVATFVSNVGQGVWGADNTNPFSTPDNCLPTADYAPGNDVLVLRRLGNVPVTVLAANTIYFQSAYGQGQVFRSPVVPLAPLLPGAGAAVATFPLVCHVYYVSPFTSSESERPLVPALWRLALQSDGSMERELVASGVERMQLQYGVQSDVPDVQFYDAIAGSASETEPANPARNWLRVKAVRLWLLVRATTPEPGYVNAQTYAMGNQPYTVHDGFRRQMFSTVVQLRN
jgi:type IV pilus assembly protein PilW